MRALCCKCERPPEIVKSGGVEPRLCRALSPKGTLASSVRGGRLGLDVLGEEPVPVRGSGAGSSRYGRWSESCETGDQQCQKREGLAFRSMRTVSLRSRPAPLRGPFIPDDCWFVRVSAVPDRDRTRSATAASPRCTTSPRLRSAGRGSPSRAPVPRSRRSGPRTRRRTARRPPGR